MTKKVLIYTFCLGILLISTQFASANPKSDVLGLRVGMSNDKAVKHLQKIAKKDHDERKQQEIWLLNNDPYFSHIIIAFDKDYKNVRYVTAKARVNGKRMRYSEVLDIKKAVQLGSANNYNYVMEVPARGSKPAHKIIARGTDKDYLTYFAVEEIDAVEQKN